ncbi:MAG: alkaline phosphatase family protein [Ferroplasma sp.]|uniref:alkaline phosphatase family protein n=1 Tax=Ferroplasma sp. TaxID=2591003 RepID=UPI002816263F|nr:alkaline phosphatase family protein [Ferroplasma sp.]WMT50759.1 MAG: alkaline phosphatase family protein [Ferroplasma sp.]
MQENFIIPGNKSLVNLSSDIFSHFGLRTETDGIGLNYKHKKLCFILLDGLGWNIYEKTGIKFRNEMKCTSVFPSTTSNALSSFFLNRYPGQHGIIGYQLYIRQLGSIVNILGYTSSAAYIRDSMERAYPMATIFNYESKVTALNRAGYSTVNIIPAFINKTSFSTLLYGNNNTDTYSNVFHSFYVLEDNLKQGKDFVSFYLPEVDQTAHKLGPYDPYTVESARYILQSLISIMEKYSDYDFVITADHGHVEVGNTINLGNDSGLMDISILPPYGDSRALFMENTSEIKEYLEGHYSNLELVAKGDSMYSALMGKIDGNVMQKLPGLIGISRNNDIYHFPLNQRKYAMKGAHSGLLKDEMEIPVLVFQN